MCEIWSEIPSHFRNPKEKTRQCLPGSRIAIQFRTEACDRFDMARSFWCSKLGQYTEARTCLARREGKGIYEHYTDIRKACRHCELGERIDNYLNAPLIAYIINGGPE